MKRLFAVALFATACSTTITTTSSPAPSPLPCRPADATINATLWQQTAAEYDAIVRQTYATAQRMLDAALADPEWNALDGAESGGSKPPAIIVDSDETILDTSPFQRDIIRAGLPYSEERWHEYAMNDASRPLVPAFEFVRHAAGRGIRVFIITNRTAEEEPALRRTLARHGFPLDPAEDNVLTKNDRPEWSSSDKTARRRFVASSHRVLMLFGDDLNDFADARGKSLEERSAIVQQNASRLGRQWFVIPNPIYGSWERSLLPSGLTPCQEMEEKVRRLR